MWNKKEANQLDAGATIWLSLWPLNWIFKVKIKKKNNVIPTIGRRLTWNESNMSWSFIAKTMFFLWPWWDGCLSLHWRHNDHDGVSNHQRHDCLLSRLFRCRSKKTSKLHVTDLCVGNSPGLVNSPHKGPAGRKMFPFDDVIIYQIVNQVTYDVHVRFVLNSLWPNDAVWWHRFGSTWAHVMVCGLMTPSRYLNQCWLIITEVLWHSP